MVMTLSRYAAGAVIVRENDCGETAYVIEQGQVEVSKELDRQPVHLAYLDEVGGAFLSGNRWCPWCSRLLEEVELLEKGSLL